MIRQLLITLLSFFWLSPVCLGQSNSSEGGATYTLSLSTGSLLPYGIEGVRELLPIWGMRFGHSIGDNMSFEYNLMAANAKGVSYYIGYVSWRTDFEIENSLPLFFLIGGDAHFYKRRDTYGEITGNLTEYDFRFASGWHLGFGSETKLSESLRARTDFRLGLGPGTQLIVTLGLIYYL